MTVNAYPHRNDGPAQTFFPPLPVTDYPSGELLPDPEQGIFWTPRFDLGKGCYDIALISAGPDCEAEVISSLSGVMPVRIYSHDSGWVFPAESCCRITLAENQAGMRLGVRPITPVSTPPGIRLIPRLGSFWRAADLSHGYGIPSDVDSWTNSGSYFEKKYLIYGPNISLQPGVYTAAFRLSCSDWLSQEPFIKLEVINSATLKLAERSICASDFNVSDPYQEVLLKFSLTAIAKNIEFRVFTLGECVCTIHQVRLLRPDDLIWERYFTLGGTKSVLGDPTGAFSQAKHPTTVGGLRRFEYGDIYWSPQFGAVETFGAVGRRYEGLGGPNSFLGFPATPPVSIVSSYGTPGVVQFYENSEKNSAIYSCSFPWGEKTYYVKGSISSVYEKKWRGGRGKLGFPLSDQIVVIQDTERSQWRSLFEGGQIELFTQAKELATSKIVFYPRPKISRCQFPDQVYAGQEALIVVEAENQGAQAKLGFLTIAFPDYSSMPVVTGSPKLQIAQLGSDLHGRYGHRHNRQGQPYQVQYLRVEDEFSPWKSGEKIRLVVRVCPSRPGPFRFFVRSSAGRIEKYSHLDCFYESDPLPMSATPLDQQDEHIYEYVIHVKEKLFPSLVCLPNTVNDLVLDKNEPIIFRFKNIGRGPAHNLTLYAPKDLGELYSKIPVMRLDPDAEHSLSVRVKPKEWGVFNDLEFVLKYQDEYGQEYEAKIMPEIHVTKSEKEAGTFNLVGNLIMGDGVIINRHATASSSEHNPETPSADQP